MVNGDQSWLSAHVYHGYGVYNKQFDAFLMEAIAPFAERCIREGWASRYFFIRYAEGGPHVRLRFFGSPTLLESVVKHELEKHLGTYFRNHATESQLQKYWTDEQLRDSFGLVRRDSVQYVPYERELARYGGPQGLEIAEEHFCHSSNIALELLELTRSQPFDIQLGIANGMLCTITKAFIPDLSEAVRFARNTCRAYLDAEIGYSAATLWQEEEKLHAFLTTDYRQLPTPLPVELMYEGFQTRFKENEQVYRDAVRKAWKEALSSESQYLPLRNWVELCKSTAEALRACVKDEQLRVGNFRPLSESQQLQAIAASLLHMMNNRFGLHLREEAWLCFLFYQSLEKYAVEPEPKGVRYRTEENSEEQYEPL